MKTIRLLTILVAFLFVAETAMAANYYVRAGAIGANNGLDWTNAYTSLPATLVRGAIYYVADGIYGSYTFDEPVSGSSWITIKKATAADHGTDTGWQTSYGAGQAVFGPLAINNSNGGYIEINGQTEYGFKIDFSEGQHGFDFIRGGPNVNLMYIDFDGITATGDYNYSASTKAINIHPWNGSGYDNTDGLLVSHCALHGGETLIQWENTSNGTIEYSDFYDSRSISSNWHQNMMFVGGGNNNTVRNNKFHNYNVEGIFFTYGGQTNWSIYGNVFYDGVSVARGIEIRQDFSYGAFYIYNNTFVNLPIGAVNNIANATSGGAGRNNIGFNAGFNWGAMPNSNNSSVDSSIFVNYSGKDFHIASATSAGISLPAPYNMDPDGKTRGADGVWDQGAYEYLSTHTVTPSAGANGSISPSTPQTVTDGSTTQFTVTPNSGYAPSVAGTCGGTLNGTVYTTNPITSDCTVIASFSPTTQPTIRKVTVKPSGGDYISLNAALAVEAGDLVALNRVLYVECYAMQDTTPVNLTGFTTDADHYIRIYTPASERHQGKWDTNKYRLETNGQAINIAANYVRIEGLQIQVTASSGTNANGISTANVVGAGDIRISYCIIKGVLSGTVTYSDGVSNNASNINMIARIFNNLFLDWNRSGASTFIGGVYTGSDTAYYFNNTFVNCYQGMYRNGGSVIAKNNLMYLCNYPAGGTFDAGTDYNATDNASIGYTVTGSGNIHDQISQTFTFANPTNGDYHLASGDAGAKDHGISDPGSGLFFDDIDGQVRSAIWDIGADEM